MNSRDLSARDIEAYGFFVGWYDEWRMGRGLALGESSARHFWRECVLFKPREGWQLDQWAEAMRWVLGWVKMCEFKNVDYRCLAERMRDAVYEVGRRRGLAQNTLRTYGGWVIRYGNWVGDAKAAMDVAKARKWLGELVTRLKSRH